MRVAVRRPGGVRGPAAGRLLTTGSLVGQALAVYGVVSLLSWTAFSHYAEPLPLATGSWDGQHYLALAEHGYPVRLVAPYSNLAFLPGMPLAIRLVHEFGLSYDDAGVTVSLLAGAVFIVCCSLLVARRYGEGAGLRAAVLLAVAPAAFLFGLSYADPLALAFVAASFLALDTQRWWTAGLLGALATATSPICLPIVLVAAWTLVGSGRRAWPVALMPAGFCGFLIYLWVHTGSPANWFRAQQRGWGQGFAPFNVWDRLSASAGPGIPVTVSICLILAAAGCFAMRRATVPVAWWLYAVPVLAISVFGRGAWPNPRYLLNAFPLTLAAAVKLQRRSFWVAAVVSLAAMQLALVAYLVFWPDQVAQP